VQAEPPLWRVVHSVLEGSLAAGDYPPGTPLPSEARLAARFGVAIGTVRRAVDELVATRALIRRQGRGTFVPDLDQAPRGPAATPFYFFHVQGQDGTRRDPRTELLEFGTGLPCPQEAAGALGVPLDTPMLRAINLQRLDDMPVMLDELWLPQALFPGLDREVFARREGTVYGLFQRRFGHSVIRVDERLRAEPADAPIALALGLTPGTPVIRIARTAFAIGDRAVEYRVSHLDTRSHEYVCSLI
jgi:GntR family transcriptional regulator